MTRYKPDILVVFQEMLTDSFVELLEVAGSLQIVSPDSVERVSQGREQQVQQIYR